MQTCEKESLSTFVKCFSTEVNKIWFDGQQTFRISETRPLLRGRVFLETKKKRGGKKTEIITEDDYFSFVHSVMRHQEEQHPALITDIYTELRSTNTHNYLMEHSSYIANIINRTLKNHNKIDKNTTRPKTISHKIIRKLILCHIKKRKIHLV